MKTEINRQQIQKAAFVSFLGALPISATATIISQGNTALWATLQRHLMLAEEAHAQASATINFQAKDTSGNIQNNYQNWTNKNYGVVNVNIVPFNTGDGDGDSG
jgi:hypothetical protein